ncbi:hypothetical protein [Aeoliella sp.]|uniref:hypothetical protein n=1 Tax=Aeoliella sp. TaxID=2795800 RepID=UPI003CCBC1DA
MQPPPDWVRKSVIFIGYERDEDLRIIGTGFFIAVPWTDNPDDGHAHYVVTAKHVVESIEARSTKGQAILRLNSPKGGMRVAKYPVSRWIHHPEESADVAVLPINVGKDDHRSILHTELLTDEKTSELEVGPGDNLIFPGLFVHHKGESANIPIMRMGNIAAMPEEPVHTSRYGKMDAYLVEARSIGGFSGSPVFLHMDGPRALRTGPAWNQLKLLGLIHGHYDGDLGHDTLEDIMLPPGPPSINMGIAIVTPAEKILGLVNSPIQVENRRKNFEEAKAREL